MNLLLVRIAEYDDATLGVLMIEGRVRAMTLEPSWRNNEHDRSCIPTGIYECAAHESEEFGETFEVSDVPGRSGILFHPGNTAEDTKGCILLGEKFALEGRAAILNSKIATLRVLRELQAGDDLVLTVVDGVFHGLTTAH